MPNMREDESGAESVQAHETHSRLIAEAGEYIERQDLGRGDIGDMQAVMADLLAALAAQPVLDPERVKTWLQREFGSVLAHDPHNPERFWGGSARALCEAAKRGELNG